MKIISADDHLSETPDLWAKRLPKSLRDTGPKFVTLDGGGQGWMIPGADAPRPLGLDVMAGRKYDEYKSSGVRWEEVRPGCYDPEARLKDMDLGGVWATVLYPERRPRLRRRPRLLGRLGDGDRVSARLQRPPLRFLLREHEPAVGSGPLADEQRRERRGRGRAHR